MRYVKSILFTVRRNWKKLCVIDGPLENFTGKVEEIDAEKSKVRVTVSMFGRETPVELEPDQAELMD